MVTKTLAVSFIALSLLGCDKPASPDADPEAAATPLGSGANDRENTAVSSESIAVSDGENAVKIGDGELEAVSPDGRAVVGDSVDASSDDARAIVSDGGVTARAGKTKVHVDRSGDRVEVQSDAEEPGEAEHHVEVDTKRDRVRVNDDASIDDDGTIEVNAGSRVKIDENGGVKVGKSPGALGL